MIRKSNERSGGEGRHSIKEVVLMDIPVEKRKRERGLSLIELLVVVAIMGILATLTAVAVTGTATSTKGAGKIQDEKTVTDAVSAFSGQHTQGRTPTLDGCKVGAAGTYQSDRLVLDGDGSGIEARSDQDDVAVNGSVDARLDRRLVPRHVDDASDGLTAQPGHRHGNATGQLVHGATPLLPACSIPVPGPGR